MEEVDVCLKNAHEELICHIHKMSQDMDRFDKST